MANETATENLTYRMSVDGQAQVIAAFEASAKAMASAAKALEGAAGSAKKIPPTFKPAKDAANDNAKAFDNLANKAQRMTPAFSAVGAAVSRLSPELGGLASAVGRAGGAMSGITAIMGGPFGLAAGAAVAAIGLAVTAYDHFSESAEKATEEQLALNKAMLEAVGAARAARDAAFEREEAQRPSQRLMIAQVTGQHTQETALLEREKYEKEYQSSLQEYGEGSILERGKPGKRPDKEWKELQARDKRRSDWATQMQHLDRLSEAPTLDERAEAGKGAVQAKRDEAEQQQREFEERARERAKLLDTEQRRYGEIRKVGMEAYQAIGATAATALSSIARGQKVTLKEVMGAIGGELVGKGVMWGFEGGAKLASSYGTDPAGWELLAIGAAAVAAGMGMGAAASSGSQQQRGGPTRQRPIASDPAYQVDTMGGRSQAPITVNYYSTFAPSAQDGQRAAQAIEEARRQGLVAA